MFYNKYQFAVLIAILSLFVVGFSVRVARVRAIDFFPSVNIPISGFVLWQIADMMRCNLWGQGRTFVEELLIVTALLAVGFLLALLTLTAQRKHASKSSSGLGDGPV